MTSTDKENTLSIKIQTSVLMNLIIMLPHAVIFIIVAFCVVIMNIHWSFLFIATLAICVSVIYFFNLHIKKSLKNSVYSLFKDQRDQWSIRLKEPKSYKISVLGTSFSSEFFIILNLIDESKRKYTAIITKDSVPDEQYRKLKVYINTHKLL